MDPTQLPLRDLHLPPDIGWWPMAPGWWVLLAIAAAALVWLSYQYFLRWRVGMPRRSALRQSQFKRAYSSPPVQVSGNMASADFSTITQRIAAHGATALAVACGRELPASKFETARQAMSASLPFPR